jgi:hypothetical protein
MDSRQVPAHGRGPTSFEDWRRTEIEIADMGKDANRGDKRRAKKANDHDLQVGAAISVINRMVHGDLAAFHRGIPAAGFGL